MRRKGFFHIVLLCTASGIVLACGVMNDVASSAESTATAVPPESTEVQATPSPEPTTTSTPQADPPTTGWIAFLNENNIWLIHPDGSETTQVTKNGSDTPRVDQFKWSPDGQTLAYSLRSDTGSAIFLYALETSTSDMVLKDDVGGGFDWSLTGKQIIFDTSFGPTDIWNNQGIWVLNLESGKRRPVLSVSAMDPQWSSDGSHVLFTNPGFEPAGYGVADFATGTSFGLPLNPSGGNGAGNCQWAPSDLLIACITVADDETNVPELRLLDVQGKILQTFLLPERMEGNSRLQWSPDAKRLAISYYEDSKAQTDTLAMDSGTYVYLASGMVSDWSSDGQWILTWESGLDVMPSISVVDVTSGQSFPLSAGMSAVWQP